MAASSSRSSFIVDIGEDYPSPSHVRAPDHVTVKLSGNDRYNAWKTQILCLLVSLDMLGFIDGRFVRPTGNSKRKVGELKAWTRSDALVKSWILGSVSEQATMYVVDRLRSKIPNADFTAKDVWDELECVYGPEIIQQAIGETEIIREEDAKSGDKSKEKEETNEEEREKIQRKTKACKDLYGCTVDQWIFSVNRILDKGEVTVTDKITSNGNTALHVAVGTSKNSEFFEKMLEKTPENILLTDLKNSDGSTLLHIAAIVGNAPAAKILVETYPDMLIQKDNVGQTPLAIALSNMHTETAECLLDNIKTDIHKDTLFSGTIELARRLLKNYYSSLDSDAVLMAIAQNYPFEPGFWDIHAWFSSMLQIEHGAGFTKYLWIFRGGLRHHRFRQNVSSLFRYAIWKCVPSMRRTLQIQLYAVLLANDVCEKIQYTVSSSQHKNYYTNPVIEACGIFYS